MSYTLERVRGGEYNILDGIGVVVGSVLRDDDTGTHYDPWFLQLPTLKDGAGEYITSSNPLSFGTLREAGEFLERIARQENRVNAPVGDARICVVSTCNENSGKYPLCDTHYRAGLM